jgi:hypothetical protein
MYDKFEVLGLFLGSVAGFLLVKVYQIWAILYWMEGMALAGKDGYWETEIWVFSIENPNLFLFIVVALFATAGNLIQKKYFRQNEKGDTKPEPYKKNEIPTE